MRPFTIYHTHLKLFTSSKDQLVKLVQQVIMPDVIYLLGATLNRQRAESIFNQTAPTGQFINNYYLLVLINETQGRPLHEWQEMIEQNCSFLAETVVIVLTTQKFNEWLSQGQKFARLVEQNAIKLTIAKGVALSAVGEFDKEKERLEMEELLKRGKYMAREFLAGAEIYMARKNYNMAAFMIHQAIEQALLTQITVKSGYEQGTHNIKRVMKYGVLVNWELKFILDNFRKRNSLTKNKLTDAYYEARYSKLNIYSNSMIEHFYQIAKQTINILYGVNSL